MENTESATVNCLGVDLNCLTACGLCAQSSELYPVSGLTKGRPLNEPG